MADWDVFDEPREPHIADDFKVFGAHRNQVFGWHRNDIELESDELSLEGKIL
jgi:hypothetical protein